MKFWNLFFFSNKFSLLSKKPGGSRVPVVKVRFVREQRIFAKGSRGPIKKRANTLLRYIKLYISSGRLQNVPPLSTILNIYGINVQKLCDDCNLLLKKQFFDDIPLVLEIWISKDLNFIFKLNMVRLNNLFQSIDTRFLKGVTNFSYFNRRTFVTKAIRNYYLEKDLKEIFQRDFTFLDVWFFSYLFFLLYFSSISTIKNFFSYSIEGSLRMFLSQMYTLNNVYKFKQFKKSDFLKNA
jgi:hypothetical protein